MDNLYPNNNNQSDFGKSMPAVCSVSFTAFNNLCKKREGLDSTELKSFYAHRYETHIPELCSDNPYEYWRERAGYSKQEMADLLGVNLQYYCDIEEDEIVPSIKFIEDFCCALDIHPVELYFDDRISSPALLDVMLKSYNHPDELSILMPQDKKIAGILDYEADPENSYHILVQEHESLRSSERLEDTHLASILEKILINDGNPLFCGFGSYHSLEAEAQRLQDRVQNNEMDYRRSVSRAKILEDILDKKGGYVFGNDWPSHKKFIQTSIKIYGSGKTARVMVDLQRSVKNNLPQKFYDEIFGMSVSLYNASVRMVNAANIMQLSQRKRDAVIEFADDFGEVLRAYDNRQVIMAQATDLNIRAIGEPNHPEYLKDMVKLPPKPRPVLMLPAPK